MSKAIRSTLVLCGLALVIIVLDQWTKGMVRQAVPLNTSASLAPWLDGIARLTHIQNTGSAFGFLPGLSRILVYVTVAAVVLIVVYFRKLAVSSVLLRVALGLQLGGAIGNLIDRVTLGAVTDYFDLGWFPIFNVADSAITIGSILLGIYALFIDTPSHAAPETSEVAEAPAQQEG